MRRNYFIFINSTEKVTVPPNITWVKQDKAKTNKRLRQKLTVACLAKFPFSSKPPSSYSYPVFNHLFKSASSLTSGSYRLHYFHLIEMTIYQYQHCIIRTG